MASKRILIVNMDAHSQIQESYLESADELIAKYEQVGIDDCSTDLSLRGYPVVRGLIGPIPENKTTVRYESTKAFEANTKIWSNTKIKRRRRTKAEMEHDAAIARGQMVGPPLSGVHQAPVRETIS